MNNDIAVTHDPTQLPDIVSPSVTGSKRTPSVFSSPMVSLIPQTRWEKDMELDQIYPEDLDSKNRILCRGWTILILKFAPFDPSDSNQHLTPALFNFT